jgi:hypothetical protein
MLHRRLQLSPASHSEAQMVKATAKRVEAVTGSLGIHRTQPQEQVAVDHDDAVLQQVSSQVVVGIVSRRRRVHGDLEAEQLGIEGPGSLDVGDREPEVMDRTEGQRAYNRSASWCRSGSAPHDAPGRCAEEAPSRCELVRGRAVIPLVIPPGVTPHDRTGSAGLCP